MAPLEELASQEAVVTSAPLGLLDLVLLAPLVTKDNQAFLEAPGPPACQVQRVKREGWSPYLAHQEQKDSQGPQDSQGLKVTEASLEPLDGQASQERRALWASRGLDFLGLLVPKVSMAYLETWDPRGVQVARGLMAYLEAQVCRAKRESLELVYQDSRDCQVFRAFLAHQGRRVTSADQVFLENTGPSAHLGFRGSEVTQDLLEYKAQQDHQELQE